MKTGQEQDNDIDCDHEMKRSHINGTSPLMSDTKTDLEESVVLYTINVLHPKHILNEGKGAQ